MCNQYKAVLQVFGVYTHTKMIPRFDDAGRVWRIRAGRVRCLGGSS